MLCKPNGDLKLVFATLRPQVNSVAVTVDITLSDVDGNHWYYSAPCMQSDLKLAHPAQELRFREWCDATDMAAKGLAWNASYYYRSVTTERLQEAYLALMSPSGFVRHVMAAERELERVADLKHAAMWKEIGDAP